MAKINPFQKTFKTLDLISFAFFFLYFISVFFHKLTSFSQDLGRHLKFGQIILKNLSVPKTNLFSYTWPDFPFINHHWLPEVIFYQTVDLFNLKALILLKLCFFLAAFFLLFFYALKKFGLFLSLLAGFISLLLFSQRTEVRPEIFSYTFFSFYLILLDSKNFFAKYYWVLPIIQIVWVNSHIYFFLGPILLFFKISDQIFKKQGQVKKTVLAFMGILLACFVNPGFAKGALYPLFVFKNYGYQIVENQSFFYMSRYIGKIFDPLFLLVLFIVFISFILTFKKQSLYDFLSFGFFSIFGFAAIRNIPIFALAVFLPLTRNISWLKKKQFKKLPLNLKINLKFLIYFLFIPVLVYLSLLRISNQLYLKHLSFKRFGFGSIEPNKKGVDFILNNNLEPPIFNNFDIGSYLIYRLYPDYKVFVDGRPEAYPASFFKDTYIPMQMDNAVWQTVDKEYNFNLIFFSHTDITPWATTFLPTIINNPNWRLVYLDDFSIIFLKNIQPNQELINKLALDKAKISYDCRAETDCYARIKRILNLLKLPDAGIKL
jgi:hypothetical protein